jgi:simple sugar transport system ATP-binding protein
MGAKMRNTSFSVFEGKTTGDLGLIGSGRTEAFKIISGIAKRDFLRGGTILLDDKPARHVTLASAVRDGIIYVTKDRYSEGVFETMSIRENLFGGLLALGNTARVARMADIKALAAEWISRLNIRAINDNAGWWNCRAAISRKG